MKNDSLTILRQSRFVAQAGEPMAIQGETLRPLKSDSQAVTRSQGGTVLFDFILA
jgi:hypothetical protein